MRGRLTPSILPRKEEKKRERSKRIIHNLNDYLNLNINNIMHTIVHIHVSSNVYGRIHRVMSITTNINISTYTNSNYIFKKKGLRE